MTFGNALVSFFKNIFNFSGRARRKEYFSVLLLLFIINIFLLFIFRNDIDGELKVAIGFSVVSLFPVSLYFRRLHDIGISGGLMAIPFLPITACFRGGYDWLLFIIAFNTLLLPFFLYLFLIDSEPNENRYGMSPKPIEDDGLILESKIKNRRQISVILSLVFILYVVYKAYVLGHLIISSEPPFISKKNLIIDFIESAYSVYIAYLALIIIVLDYTKRKIITVVASIILAGLSIKQLYSAVIHFQHFSPIENAYFKNSLGIECSIVNEVLLLVIGGIFLWAIYTKDDNRSRLLGLLCGGILLLERVFVFLTSSSRSFDPFSFMEAEGFELEVGLNIITGAYILLIIYNKRLLQKFKEEKASLPVNAVQE